MGGRRRAETEGKKKLCAGVGAGGRAGIPPEAVRDVGPRPALRSAGEAPGCRSVASALRGSPSVPRAPPPPPQVARRGGSSVEGRGVGGSGSGRPIPAARWELAPAEETVVSWQNAAFRGAGGGGAVRGRDR